MDDEARELVRRLQEQVEQLRQENARLRDQLEQAQRDAARQAAPFRRPDRLKKPKEAEKGTFTFITWNKCECPLFWPPSSTESGYSIKDVELHQRWTLDNRGTWLEFYDGTQFHTADPTHGTFTQSDGMGNDVVTNIPAAFRREQQYDAWNRLVGSKRIIDVVLTEGETRKVTAVQAAHLLYQYDALGRMIGQTSLNTGGGAVLQTEFFHSAAWQPIVEKHVEVGGGQATTWHENVWSLAYVDAMVFQEQDDGESVQRIYPLQDAAWNVTTLLTEQQGEWAPAERILYDPYGVFDYRSADWERRGEGEAEDDWPKWQYFHHGGYFTNDLPGNRPAGDAMYHFRRRAYDPFSGRWAQPDPSGYIDSLNLHEYLGSNPLNSVDPTGELLWLLPVLVGAALVGGTGYYIGEAGYYGGEQGARDAADAAVYGLRGGGSIVSNTLTFGGTDRLGWTDSQSYQGAEFTASRVLAVIGREVGITAVTMGTAQVARGGTLATGWGAAIINRAAQNYTRVQIARGVSLGVIGYDVASGSYQVGTGIYRVSTGDAWGALDIVTGALRVGGGFLGRNELARRFSKHGPLGNPLTRNQNRAVARALEKRGWKLTHGGGISDEELVYKWGSKALADITVTNGSRVLRVNTATTTATGKFLLYEIRQARRMRQVYRNIGEVNPHVLLVAKWKDLSSTWLWKYL